MRVQWQSHGARCDTCSYLQNETFISALLSIKMSFGGRGTTKTLVYRARHVVEVKENVFLQKRPRGQINTKARWDFFHVSLVKHLKRHFMRVLWRCSWSSSCYQSRQVFFDCIKQKIDSSESIKLDRCVCQLTLNLNKSHAFVSENKFSFQSEKQQHTQ